MGGAVSTRLVSVMLSAVLLASCAPLHPDVRPEVARPLDEARVLANGWSNRAVVLAKLNQAASVPNLNRDEQDRIRATTIYALARNGVGGIPGAESGNVPQRDSAQSSINSTWPYR
jgi:hypothetical protein